MSKRKPITELKYYKSTERLTLLAEAARFESSLTTWADWIGRLERRLRNKILAKEGDSFTRDAQKHYIGEISRFLKEAMQDEKLDSWNAHQVEWFFNHIAWLIQNTSSCAARMASNEMFRTMTDFLRGERAISKAQLDELKVKMQRFQRVTDPKKALLFERSVDRFFKKTKGILSKRGYTFNLALEEENVDGTYFSRRDYELQQIDLERSFATWRFRHKSVVSQIKRKYADAR